MSVFELDKFDLKREYEWFYRVLSGFSDEIGLAVSGVHNTISYQPRRLGFTEHPYHLAADIHRLYEYATGRHQATAKYVHETISQVTDLLFQSPYQALTESAVKVDWKWLRDRTLGKILLAARARANAEDGVWLISDEVNALVGMTSAQLKKRGVPSKKIRGRLSYEPNAIRFILAELVEKHVTR